MGENIHLEKNVADGVAVIRLDRPKVNALGSDMMRDLHAICDELAVDDTTRAVVVTGGRKNFAAGADISEFPSFTAETAQQFSNMFNDSLLALENLPQVTISAINGFALGGGLEVAVATDFRMIAEDGRMGVPEIQLGLIPGGGGTQRIPRLIGIGRAMEVVLGADDVDAETAERWGFLNRAMSGDSLSAYVDALATRIASFPPAAVREAKRAVNASVERSLDEGLKYESYLFQVLLRDVDAQPSMRRYLDAGGQTRDVELRIGSVMGELFDT